jgi:hypothetical protein
LFKSPEGTAELGTGDEKGLRCFAPESELVEPHPSLKDAHRQDARQQRRQRARGGPFGYQPEDESHLHPLDQFRQAEVQEGAPGVPQREARHAQESQHGQEEREGRVLPSEGQGQVSAEQAARPVGRQCQGDEEMADLGRHLGDVSLQVGAQKAQEDARHHPHQRLGDRPRDQRGQADQGDRHRKGKPRHEPAGRQGQQQPCAFQEQSLWPERKRDTGVHGSVRMDTSLAT